MFEELFRWFPDLQITSEPARLLSPFINGIKRMDCAYTPTKVNLDSPQVKAGVADATTKAVTWLRKTLEREGSKLKVSGTPLKSLDGIGK